MQTIIDKLAATPWIFNLLRNILELGYPAQKTAIRKYLQLGTADQLIDIGCGTGEFSPLFVPGQYTGIDLEPVYIDFAKKHFPGNFLVADATALPFADNAFSRGLTIGMLHHMSDETASRVLREVARVLKPEGRMLIMEDVVSGQDGFLTRLIHGLDKGDNIRPAPAYRDLLGDYFEIEHEYWAKSGTCPYQVFWLKNKK